MTPNSPVASDQPTRMASWASAGIEWATMPTTLSCVRVGPVANCIESPTWMPAESASDLGTITEPPASRASRAFARSPETKFRRPSTRKSCPTIAAASWRTTGVSEEPPVADDMT